MKDFTDSDMDDVYDRVDEMMRKGNLFGIAEGYDNCGDNIDECITWLSSSLPFKSKMRDVRKPLIEKVTKLLIENGEDPEKALYGLT